MEENLNLIDLEKRLITKALTIHSSKGRKKQAEILGLSERNLFFKMKKYGINIPVDKKIYTHKLIKAKNKYGI